MDLFTPPQFDFDSTMNTYGLDLESSFDFGFDEQMLQGDLHQQMSSEQITNTTTTTRSVPNRVSLACIPCRSRHTKCNATKPSCSRCQHDGRQCTYATSRRGGKRKAAPQKQAAIDDDDIVRSPNLNSSPQILPPREIMARVSSSEESGLGVTPNSSDISTNLGSYQHTPVLENSLGRLLDLYYAFFHNAHPCILPRQQLDLRLLSNYQSLQHLVVVLGYIGSLYTLEASSDKLRAYAKSELCSGDLPSDGFSVQALFLFAIAEHSNDEFEQAQQLLDKAISMALNIRMQSRNFATENGENDPVLQESWRRTWWGLYLADGIFAATRNCTAFTLWDVKTDVDLPCEETAYLKGDIPRPRTLLEYEAREIAEEDFAFSSFAYLVDAARIIGCVLSVRSELREPFDSLVSNADARMVNWGLHLPKYKQEVFQENGEIDELLFQAHMMINVLKVRLHRPHSRLSYSHTESKSKCTRSSPPSDQMLALGKRAIVFHTAKTIEALNTSLTLFALPGKMIKHTPLIICAIGLAIMGQLSAYNLDLKGAERTASRERIRLGLGALKVYAEIWKFGRRTECEMKVIARELLLSTTSERNPLSSLNEILIK